ncbi:TetR/AcrR family transcriptional regulator [Variovorax sp. J22G21]|uniref:TetR/AcrR family transcriptional regulator n=1 Tax=Variovorax fucosicus TaxID=3053517 RepID=UPI002576DB6B|nr:MULTISPECIES: TetR/AcrR family transcriptional regulator [unclassified Variovorax]MDM0038463.1 TetR/AcrR family transcriptional regulator [Variovorax sp. J22R193]MDM0063239.1 TetR/AcrR family transcriptional regulator [Variovorax sp. J22G21]
MPMKKTIAAEARTRDADRSRKAILQAARNEFSVYGLGGARLERIAAEASVHKRLVYYYFQDKDGLFSAVLESVYEEIRDAQLYLDLKDMAPLAALRRLIEFTWDYYIAHPEFITFLNSENLHKARHLAASPRIKELNSPLLQTLAGILERGQKEGVFRAGIDPMQLYITMAGCAYFYLSNIHTLSVGFSCELGSQKMLTQRMLHIIDVVTAYVLR